MVADILWRFLILETFVMGALCCTCDDVHPQTDFCTSEFVLNVEIHEEIKRPMEKVFWIKIKKVFKGDVRELKFMRNRYVILEMLDGCHVEDMKPGNTFVIFGNNHNRNIHTDKCYGNMRWEETTVFYRRALVKYYNDNCDCYDKIGNYTSDKLCHWYFSFMKNIGKNCKWVDTDYFKRCQKAVRSSWK